MHSTSSATTNRIFEQYAAKTPGSAELYRRAVNVFPGGVTHDTRYLQPYPLYVERAAGSRKWDVDGHEYVDYIGGHGALLLGHAHPQISEAVREQLAKGTHFGASHELELQLGEQIQKMVPCAGRVRFTGSGTESTLLAIRIARAFTGKRKIVRFAGHFHGWHDQVAFAVTSHFDGTPPPGVLPGVTGEALVCPPGEPAKLEQLLSTNDDVAAVILEPTGATFGLVPLPAGFLEQARKITARHGVLLIFDEVITGFRVSPGGAQRHFGVTPDLATFAKIVAGGFPGGAVAGRKDVMDVMTMRDDRQWNLDNRVPHQGTFNANPVTAAAGLATLRLIDQGDVIPQADRIAAHLRERMNDAIRQAGSSWLVYGESSGFHFFTNPQGRSVTVDDIYSGVVTREELKGGVAPSVIHQLRCGMILGGADVFPWPGGVVSAVHSEEDVEITAAAFKACLEAMEL
ncbi:MAG: aminotransferase class III-fold pyridoxal phosphate-dependent enzyme [Planctomycetota bacterium]|nr:MAG: aminotransferase class III-fold pyridoxal phosphate-dependent enzyme [Planctomycetota bacterium]